MFPKIINFFNTVKHFFHHFTLFNEQGRVFNAIIKIPAVEQDDNSDICIRISIAFDADPGSVAPVSVTQIWIVEQSCSVANNAVISNWPAIDHIFTYCRKGNAGFTSEQQTVKPCYIVQKIYYIASRHLPHILPGGIYIYICR